MTPARKGVSKCFKIMFLSRGGRHPFLYSFGRLRLGSNQSQAVFLRRDTSGGGSRQEQELSRPCVPPRRALERDEVRGCAEYGSCRASGAESVEPKLAEANKPNSDGLQPTSEGLQPTSDGPPPSSDGLHIFCFKSRTSPIFCGHRT